MPHQGPIDIADAATPGLLRRLAAIGYDSLLLAALYVLVSALVVLPAGMLFGSKDPAGDALVRLLLQLLLTLVTMGFFVGFWLHGGQTLGMRAWRIRVVRADGYPLHAGNALLRALCALISWVTLVVGIIGILGLIDLAALLSWAALGLGLLWMPVSREGLTWHDRLSGTRLVLLRKPERN